MKPFIYIACICFSILSYGQRIQSHESIRQHLVAWDTIRGSWLFDAIHAIHTNQAVPDRTFPEDLTPAELFSLAPVEDRESLQNTLLNIYPSDAFIELMNEVHRVLKPGGIFLAQTPVYPFSACFTDPTHVNPVTSETFSLYFDDQRKWGAMYGFNGAFHIQRQVLFSTHLLTVMQKV
jgi:SAM-dependent methyltransferase